MRKNIPNMMGFIAGKNVIEHSASTHLFAGEWKYHKVTKFKYIVLNPMLKN
jgi:hypothetical protein